MGERGQGGARYNPTTSSFSRTLTYPPAHSLSRAHLFTGVLQEYEQATLLTTSSKPCARHHLDKSGRNSRLNIAISFGMPSNSVGPVMAILMTPVFKSCIRRSESLSLPTES